MQRSLPAGRGKKRKGPSSPPQPRKRYQAADENYLLAMVQDVVNNLHALIANVPVSQIGDATGDALQDAQAKRITAPDNRNVSAVMHLAPPDNSDESQSDSEAPDEIYFAANSSTVGAAQRELGADCIIIADTVTGKHAEMKILDHFFGNGQLDDMGYIGISKPCCLACAAVLVVAQQEHVPVDFKGTHGLTYNTGWVLPDYISLDQPLEDHHDGTTRFEIFMGPTAMAKYWLINAERRRTFLSRLNSRISQ